MNKNIRRSIAVAATASGVWALGTAAAGAAELPVSVPHSPPDTAADTAAETVDGIGADVQGAEGTAGHAAGHVKDIGHASHTVTGQVHHQVQHGVHHQVDHRIQDQHQVLREAQHLIPAPSAAPAGPAASSLPAVNGTDRADAIDGIDGANGVDVIDYLFGPIDQIPGYSQAAGQAVARTTDATGAALGTTTLGDITHVTPHGAAAPMAGMTGVTGAAADSVLPPVAVTAVDGVLPVAGQAVGDAGGITDGVVFDVQPTVQGVVAQVRPPAQGVVSAAQPAVHGAAAQVKPLAQGLGATVARHARLTVGHAVSGASSAVESVTPGSVTDALRSGGSPLS
ncbi:hypothetical protein G3I19_17625 [Streptomyces sp. SID10853]|uniref:hypothetical protein n=1 Tax=Streptomyces sp. SID10853 TaxID=2706028 RepID=UPI0013C0CD22|nr:hypothetical protein [Streptomyces sp. SID10853]NDZ80312.1 hypothetical protein [Streptomyces sp. SID10853]